MNKTYKCFYCEHDTGPTMTPKIECEQCFRGSNFDLKKRMTRGSEMGWRKHQQLDKLLENADAKLANHQIELAHRLLERPSYSNCPRSTRLYHALALRSLFRDVVEHVKLEVPNEG